MAKSLIIVESPAKTKTLKNFLGKDFEIEASMGHVRDLPTKVLGVDLDKDFEPTYTDLATRGTVLTKLAKAVKGSTTVYLATDPDREGEAIAWHLQEALKLKGAKRIEFNEITRTAVTRAIENPRAIDMGRVNAQQARRVLDRLVGYKLSPLLWRKMSRNTLSAGRVQSVAVKLIVDREREIRAFVPTEYWSITANLTPFEKRDPFNAELKSKGKEKLELNSEKTASTVMKDLDGALYKVKTITTKPTRRQSPQPFITSTLQQEAARKLGFNARHTMRIAQSLYEGVELSDKGAVGLITYMRTDSTRIADEAIAAAKDFITGKYGSQYIKDSKAKSKSKVKVQDAHEAIRPTDVTCTPESIAQYLDKDQQRLYDLIWNRFVASQMADALFDVTSVDIEAQKPGAKGDPYIFRASGSVLKFAGWRAVYLEGKDEADVTDEEKAPLPSLLLEKRGDLNGTAEKAFPFLQLLSLLPEQHFTQPPPRFTEATLVKTLEANGVGRPSTYATILETIRERKYVEMDKKAFKPTPLGEVVNDYLVDKFSTIVDVKFTAGLEDDLDKIADESMDWVKVLRGFYDPFAKLLDEASQEKGYINIPDQETDKLCPTCGKPMVIKHGRKSPFYACTGYPECKTTKSLGATGMPCPLCSEGEIIERKTKRGKVFYGCGAFPKCRFASWDRPTGEKCPDCASPLVESKGGKTKPKGILCSQKCGYFIPAGEEVEVVG